MRQLCFGLEKKHNSEKKMPDRTSFDICNFDPIRGYKNPVFSRVAHSLEVLQGELLAVCVRFWRQIWWKLAGEIYFRVFSVFYWSKGKLWTSRGLLAIFFDFFKAFFSIVLQLNSSFVVNSSFENLAVSKAIFGFCQLSYFRVQVLLGTFGLLVHKVTVVVATLFFIATCKFY